MSTLCLTGGRVLRPDCSIESADVVVDRDAGRIRAVGPDAAAERDAAETLDAEGCLVIPGLVNGHTHVAMTLLRSHGSSGLSSA